jgi:putative flippase GtrA
MAQSMTRSWRERLWILVRSSLVGVLATLTDLCTLFVLVRWVGLPEAEANIPSLLPGLAVMFFGNKYFAFEDRSAAVLRQGGRFLFVEAWAFVLNVVLFHLLVTEWRVPFLLARMAGTATVYLGFSFPLWTFIFHKPAVAAGPLGAAANSMARP